jgi:hypothetical protein
VGSSASRQHATVATATASSGASCASEDDEGEDEEEAEEEGALTDADSMDRETLPLSSPLSSRDDVATGAVASPLHVPAGDLGPPEADVHLDGGCSASDTAAFRAALRSHLRSCERDELGTKDALATFALHPVRRDFLQRRWPEVSTVFDAASLASNEEEEGVDGSGNAYEEAEEAAVVTGQETDDSVRSRSSSSRSESRGATHCIMLRQPSDAAAAAGGHRQRRVFADKPSRHRRGSSSTGTAATFSDSADVTSAEVSARAGKGKRWYTQKRGISAAFMSVAAQAAGLCSCSDGAAPPSGGAVNAEDAMRGGDNELRGEEDDDAGILLGAELARRRQVQLLGAEQARRRQVQLLGAELARRRQVQLAHAAAAAATALTASSRAHEPLAPSRVVAGSRGTESSDDDDVPLGLMLATRRTGGEATGAAQPATTTATKPARDPAAARAAVAPAHATVDGRRPEEQWCAQVLWRNCDMPCMQR